ncbi:MAG: deoxyribodipyrimidine photo-lyase [Quisquiliibacterium sp.]
MTRLYQDVLVWFRRDLRCEDHHALSQALADGQRVWCAFVFDREILDALPSRRDRRVEFIRESLVQLDQSLRAAGGGLVVLHGRAREAIVRLAARLGVDAVYANHDYEPLAVSRDAHVAQALASEGRIWCSFKDQVIFEKDEVLTAAGKPFSVFTPYRNAWLRRLTQADVAQCAIDLQDQLAPPPPVPDPSIGYLGPGVPSLEQLGFEATNLTELKMPVGASGAASLFEEFSQRIGQYQRSRDFPALRGPSYLSVHLRFGTIALRRLVRFALQIERNDPAAAEGARTWLSELVWREFYFQILHHNPHVVERAFRPEYDRIEWERGSRADDLFAAWCEARTGYPLVDAAMAQLNHSGYMHNRLRMVTASFLVKDLGIDWRRGEAYFAAQLNDFDLAANNGGWQWAASTGCDAQPWFRIFNPVTQSEKFDARGSFIRRYLGQLAELPDKLIHAPWLASASQLAAAGVQLGASYPHPVVDHAQARERTLARYSVVKKPAN